MVATKPIIRFNKNIRENDHGYLEGTFFYVFVVMGDYRPRQMYVFGPPDETEVEEREETDREGQKIVEGRVQHTHAPGQPCQDCRWGHPPKTVVKHK